MKQFVIPISISFIFILSSCQNPPINENNVEEIILSGEKPPPVTIEVNDEIYNTQLGSYCWGSPHIGQSECVDTAGPIELLDGEKPVQVSPNDVITLNIGFTPLPNDVTLYLLDGDKEVEVQLEQNQFSAPLESGTYYYSYEVKWLDHEDIDFVYADAFYAFFLKVN